MTFAPTTSASEGSEFDLPEVDFRGESDDPTAGADDGQAEPGEQDETLGGAGTLVADGRRRFDDEEDEDEVGDSNGEGDEAEGEEDDLDDDLDDEELDDDDDFDDDDDDDDFDDGDD